MSRWQKETFENTFPGDTHIHKRTRAQQSKWQKERTSFCEGVSAVCCSGRKVQADNERAPQGTTQAELFLSTFASHLHSQTKHEMTIVSNAPCITPFQQAAGEKILTSLHPSDQNDATVTMADHPESHILNSTSIRDRFYSCFLVTVIVLQRSCTCADCVENVAVFCCFFFLSLCRWEVRGWKRDRFTVRFIEASQTASRPRIPPLRLLLLPS